MAADPTPPVSEATLASRAGHAHGCREPAHPSLVLAGYGFCPGCHRHIRDDPDR